MENKIKITLGWNKSPSALQVRNKQALTANYIIEPLQAFECFWRVVIRTNFCLVTCWNTDAMAKHCTKPVYRHPVRGTNACTSTTVWVLQYEQNEMAVESIPSPLAGWKREPFIGVIITASTSHTIIWELEASFTVSIQRLKNTNKLWVSWEALHLLQDGGGRTEKSLQCRFPGCARSSFS